MREPRTANPGRRRPWRFAMRLVLIALAWATLPAIGTDGGAPVLASPAAHAQAAATAAPAAAPATEAAGWIEKLLPEYFVSLRLLEIRLWQWVVLIALVAVASFVGLLVSAFLIRAATALARRTETTFDDTFLPLLSAPLRYLLAIFFFYLATLPLGLPGSGQEAIAVICRIGAVVSVTWLVLRLTDAVAALAEKRFDGDGAVGARTLVPIGRRATKVFVLAVALLSLLQNLGFNVAGLLAGLGIGGIALALAAQKSLENLFGGILVLADRPVKVGEFCRVGEHIGTVEDIGLRSSRIRTLDRTVVTIPNAEFSTARIENYAVRDSIRLYTTIQVGYDTSPDQMRYLLVEIRRMLYAHPKTTSDPCRVRFVNFGAYSLDLEVFVYLDTAVWNEFLGIREDIYLRIMDIVAASGTYFAYPSQTLYLGRDGGRDMERAGAAERDVERWRAAGEIPLPEFPPASIAEIDDTLPFPPPGSAAAAG